MSKNHGKTMPYSISQNFLTSKQTIWRLIRRAGIQPTDTVLEIGAGKGHLTKPLSEACRTLISYEIDPALCARLQPQLRANVRLYCKDFLQCALPSDPYKVFANIPFSRTSEIVRKLTSAAKPPSDMWLVMEKGAAKRFCGQPRESLSSLLLKPFFDVSIVYYFSREDFHPAPRTDVVMLALHRRETPDLPPSQRDSFARFVRHGLQHGLSGSRALLSKKQCAAALRLAGLPPLPPSGDTLYVQWLCLFRCWLQFGRR